MDFDFRDSQTNGIWKIGIQDFNFQEIGIRDFDVPNFDFHDSDFPDTNFNKYIMCCRQYPK